MFNLKKTILGVAAAGLTALFSSQAYSATIVWDLISHPNGSLASQHGAYGFRFDYFTPPLGNGPVFNFDGDAATDARLVFNNDPNNLSAVISGNMYNNHDGTTWHVSYTLTGISLLPNSGDDRSFIASGGNGTITTNTGVAIAIMGKQKSGTNVAFEWDSDGHRVAGDTEQVGRGWIKPLDLSPEFLENDQHNYNDFLFLGQEIAAVPLPASAFFMLAGLAGLGALRMRRKSKIA